MKKFMIKVNGTQYEVEVEEIIQETSNLVVGPQKALTTEAKPQQLVKPQEQAQPSVSSNSIKAPMPGTVLKVSLKTGDQVKKGQVILILEAMKMENEITAPQDGKISNLHVVAGQSVNAGDVLVSFE